MSNWFFRVCCSVSLTNRTLCYKVRYVVTNNNNKANSEHTEEFDLMNHSTLADEGSHMESNEKSPPN